ncbi:MAG TPA: hypothetical protein VGQ57_01460 [Polyangiaceae bacterium]|jgi:hypothetical protein|nr:hypothetical protein [Polyangiaceae bacterium]
MSARVSLERFRALLEAYGARPSLWPEAEREAALALRDGSSEAQALFDAEAALDQHFAAVAEPVLAPDFLRRLNEVPLRAPQKRAFFSLRGLWLPAVSWALAAVVGIGWGVSAAPVGEDEVDYEQSVLAVDTGTPGTAPAPSSLDDDMAALARGTLVEFEE